MSAPSARRPSSTRATRRDAIAVSELNTPILSGSGGWIAVIMLNAYVAFFAATWGPIVWVLLGGVFPTRSAPPRCPSASWPTGSPTSSSGELPRLVKVSLGLAYGLFTVGALVSFFYVLKFVQRRPRASNWRTWRNWKAFKWAGIPPESQRLHRSTSNRRAEPCWGDDRRFDFVLDRGMMIARRAHGRGPVG